MLLACARSENIGLSAIRTKCTLLRIPDDIRLFSALRTLNRIGHNPRVCRLRVQLLRAVQRIFSTHNLISLSNQCRAATHTRQTYTHIHTTSPVSGILYSIYRCTCRITTPVINRTTRSPFRRRIISAESEIYVGKWCCEILNLPYTCIVYECVFSQVYC